MMDGSDLRCIGIVGDGCGGGREFFIKNNSLKVKDPITQDVTVLLENIKNPIKLTKKGCLLYIKTKSDTIKFNLSKLAVE